MLGLILSLVSTENAFLGRFAQERGLKSFVSGENLGDSPQNRQSHPL
jgi:hypothetical protein